MSATSSHDWWGLSGLAKLTLRFHCNCTHWALRHWAAQCVNPQWVELQWNLSVNWAAQCINAQWIELQWNLSINLASRFPRYLTGVLVSCKGSWWLGVILFGIYLKINSCMAWHYQYHAVSMTQRQPCYEIIWLKKKGRVPSSWTF